MKLNGETVLIFSDILLSEFLNSKNYNSSKIAVEINGNIIPKSEYSKTILKNSDIVEIVCFVGGG